MSERVGPGRLSKRVYRRRRIAVLMAFLAVVAVVVLIVAGPSKVAGWFGAGADSGSNAKGSASVDDKTPNGSTGADEGDSADGTGSSEGSGSADGSDSAEGADSSDETAKPAIPGPCQPADLAVEAITDAGEYAAGENPLLSLRVTNHGEPCDADFGTATMKFTVTSGSELYWDSTHCQTDASKNLVRIESGQTLETEVLEWDRTRSSVDTCDDEREAVPAEGSSYHLTVEVAGVQSVNSKQFLLY